MDAIQIYGGNCLNGQIKVQGSKNAVLPILAAALLINGTCEIENCPIISDVHHMLRLMESLCCTIERKGHTVRVDARQVADCIMPQDSVRMMRSSITLLGVLLARTGSVSMQYPGGCVIGQRPIDLHLQGLRKMGVTIEEREDGFTAQTAGLTGAVHRLPFVSVGATENLVLAAVLAKGETVIENAAREPEIYVLCDFLKQAGAQIDGTGTDRLVIHGVDTLHEISYRAPADRIVAGTYLAACLCNGGEIYLKEAPYAQMGAVIQTAVCMGAEIHEDADGMQIACKKKRKMPPKLKTDSYPGFPTDLQSAFLTAMTLAEGEGVLEETIFENRFRIVSELVKMGAHINVQDNRVFVEGIERLHGACLEAEELRGGAALAIAGAAADGITTVKNRRYIERGYEDICKDLRAFGVKCKKTDDNK
ncbi:MAG: UDP-N-acetylglucosamine 1-carboxyvinyltransferase [Bacillus sp. (in: Bacteria)]|nr:UDP-N-acetylglucosamine 1-carboxyvinyltransferase [Bacillus sp. (in: firmicutes)]MCM1427395.1 UDP-N-acetylglucosamine 1-carboxyvinyltransferase [Eubacterium sp.]